MKPSLIVHPVSYSPGGKTALATAVALARVSGADLHVLELTGRRRSPEDSIVRPIGDANVEPHFAEFVRSVYAADVRISAVELVGDVVGAVAGYARSAAADLVVVAAEARSHGPYWRRGMYANDLARHLSIPLVSVPPSRDERLRGDGASSEEAKSHAEAIARTLGRRTSALAGAGSIREGIVTMAEEPGADLIVMARSGARDHVSMKSSLARLLRHAPRPVLVLPAPATDRFRVPLAANAAVSETVLSR